MDASDYKIYVLSPMDDGWDDMLGADPASEPLASILQRARGPEFRWEGDFRPHGHPRRIPVPDGEYGTHQIYVWKQENNGTTFVASPVRLPWLEERDLKD